MSGIANMTLKGRHMPRSTTGRSGLKPFVVSSISTKRYAPRIKTAVVEKPSPSSPQKSTKDGSLATRGAGMKQTQRAASTVVPKAELRRPSSMPMPSPPFKDMSRDKKSAAVSPAASKNLSTLRTSFPKATKMVEKSKEGTTMGGRPVPARLTQPTTRNDPVLRPSCIPRCRASMSSVEAATSCKTKQGITVKPTPCPRTPGTDRRELCADTITTKTVDRRVTGTSVKQAIVAGERCSKALTRNEKLRRSHPIGCPSVALQALPAPNLSSFPSQSWAIVVDVNVKQIEKPTAICGDTSPSSNCGAKSPSVSSSSPTVIATPHSSIKSTTEADTAVNLVSPTGEPSIEVSRAVSDPTIISTSRNGATSVATLASIVNKNHAESPGGVSDTANGAQMAVRYAFEMARNIFSPSRLAPQADASTVPSNITGINVSHMRKLFIPPVDKDAKASKNPMTQMEIEMLRARRKVAGGGVVDPRLDRLGSLAAMAIVTKFGQSSPTDG